MKNDSRRFWVPNALVWGVYAALGTYSMVASVGWSSGAVLITTTFGLMLFLASGAVRAIALRGDWLDRDARGLALRMLASSVIGAVFVQAVIAAVLLSALALGWVTVPGGQANYSPGAFFAYLTGTAVPLVLWSAGWAGARALRRARDSELARLKAEAGRQRMELELLRARLNPHFVFNALNNLRALISEDPVRARDLVTRLSGTLRQALEHNPRSLVSLSEEMAVVEDYLGIEGVHYEQRLRVRRHIDGDALQAWVPPMSLQLLVENAIKHGIGSTPGGGELTISARQDGGVLHIEVGNPGRLRDANGRRGVGLAYLRTQLEQMDPPGALDLREEGARVLARMEVAQ